MKKLPGRMEEEMGLEPIEVDLESVDVKFKKDYREDMYDDYRLLREKLTVSIIRSSEVLDEAVKMVKSSPMPMQIQAASTVLKSIADNAERLMSMHEKMRQIEDEYDTEETEVGSGSTGNNSMTANLKDVISLIQKREEKKAITG